ncbi:MAG: hypothetical protein PHS99_08755 [Candidatus Marinimicrobia bacterium]|nr:hypothetical protein [Candidatus Neomarinimicrobiota bacterium]
MDNTQRNIIKEELKKFRPPLCEEYAPCGLWYHLYWLIDAVVHDDMSIDMVIFDALDGMRREYWSNDEEVRENES